MVFKYRNNLIHSEDETKHLPQLLNLYDNKDSLLPQDWNELIREIALICINYFSYDNKLSIKL